MKSDNEIDNDVFVKDTAERFLESQEPEEMLELLIQIAIRIKDRGTAPSPMMNATSIVFGLDPDTEIEDIFPEDFEPERRKCLIDHDGECWIPFFTSSDEIKNFDDTEVTDVPIREIVEEALFEENINGIVINPDTIALALRKELLAVILDLVDKVDSEAC